MVIWGVEKKMMVISCCTNLSSFQGMGKLGDTGKKTKEKGKKKKRPMNVQWLPTAMDGYVKISNKAKHHHQHHHTASSSLSNAPGHKVIYFTETRYFSNDHTILTLVIKAAIVAKQSLCREWSIENTKTCIWLVCIPKAAWKQSFHCGEKKNPFKTVNTGVSGKLKLLVSRDFSTLDHSKLVRLNYRKTQVCYITEMLMPFLSCLIISKRHLQKQLLFNSYEKWTGQTTML